MGKFKDLTGEKFGRLKVIEVFDKRGNNYYWKCICDCGNETIIKGGSLTSGNTKSCGCFAKEIVSKKHTNDLTGKRFGRLVATKKVGSKRNNALWLCKCDCGNEKEIISANLVNGVTHSCGCLQKELASQLNKPRRNVYEKNKNYVKVKLENTSNYFLCDTEDWEKQKDFTWFESAGYATAHKTINNKDVNVSFHSEVMNREDGLVVDHINRNRLDNRKCNLRVVTQRVNSLNRGVYKNNTSGITGVSKRKDTGRWSSRIVVNGKTICLGCYDTLKEAKIVREKAEEKYFKPLLE